MDPARLLLVTASLSDLPHEARKQLWSSAVDFAVREAADGFEIDPALANRRARYPSSTIEAVESLVAIDATGGLRLLKGCEQIVKLVGPEVLALNIYRRREFVAGISDWGSDIDLITSEETWSRGQTLVGGFELDVVWDLTEILERPII